MRRSGAESKRSRSGGASGSTSSTDNHKKGLRIPQESKSFRRVLLIVFVASLSIGYLSGKARSPDYSHPGEAADSIARYVTKYAWIDMPDWEVDRMPDGRIRSLRLTGGVLSFYCGYKGYVRDMDTGTEPSNDEWQRREIVRSHVSPADAARAFAEFDDAEAHGRFGVLSADARRTFDLLNEARSSGLPALDPRGALLPRQGASLNEVAGVMLGGVELYTMKYAASEVTTYWKEIRSTSKLKRVGKALQLIGAMVSGFAIGFYLGYEDAPDCGSSEFSDQLKEKELWKRVGANLIAVYSIGFRRDQTSGAILDLQTIGRRPVSLRELWLTVNSVRRDFRLQVESQDFSISNHVRDSLLSTTRDRDPVEYLPFWISAADFVTSILSKEYRDSRLYFQLRRAILEELMWVKNEDQTWRANDDQRFEDRVEGILFERDLKPVASTAPN